MLHAAVEGASEVDKNYRSRWAQKVGVLALSDWTGGSAGRGRKCESKEKRDVSLHQHDLLP